MGSEPARFRAEVVRLVDVHLLDASRDLIADSAARPALGAESLPIFKSPISRHCPTDEKTRLAEPASKRISGALLEGCGRPVQFWVGSKPI